MKCPICKKEVVRGEPDFPFCGERCRLLDLGNWASGKYAIPGPPLNEPKQEPPEGDES